MATDNEKNPVSEAFWGCAIWIVIILAGIFFWPRGSLDKHQAETLDKLRDGVGRAVKESRNFLEEHVGAGEVEYMEKAIRDDYNRKLGNQCSKVTVTRKSLHEFSGIVYFTNGYRMSLEITADDRTFMWRPVN